jgi:hypothetical protein
MARVYLFFISILLISLVALGASAQENNVVVPDVTGLPVAQAAARLNEAGLNLGAQTAVTDAAGAVPNTVISQAVAVGTSVAYGTAIDLSVVLPPNARLIYDDNDITLVNITDQATNTSGLVFISIEGTTASYAASQWDSSLREHQCFQLWSLNRNGPKGLEECDFIQVWRTTADTSAHFWTQSNGVMRFAVQENGVERAVCPAAPANSQDIPTVCEFYLAGGGGGSDTTGFVYFAYTTDAIVLINTSDDLWMPSAQNNLYNYNPGLSSPGAALSFGNPDLLREEHRVNLGIIAQLAPGQCLMYTLTTASVSEAPEGCHIIAQRALEPNIAFWTANFEVESVIDGLRRICPAAVPNRLTRCIVRR